MSLEASLRFVEAHLVVWAGSWASRLREWGSGRANLDRFYVDVATLVGSVAKNDRELLPTLIGVL